MQRKNWTDEERSYFIDNYPYMTNKDIADKLGRNLLSITNEARRLGLKVAKKIWSDDQIQYLKDNASSKTYKELREYIGKTDGQIFHKLNTLGLTKRKPKSTERYERRTYYRKWTNDEIVFVENNYNKIGISECAKQLDRTQKSVKHVIDSLNSTKTKTIKKIMTADYLNQKYVIEGKSQEEIAIEIGCSRIQVHLAIHRHGISLDKPISALRSRSKNWKGCGDMPASIFSNIKRNSVKRKIDFDLNIEFLWNLYVSQDKKCALSNVSIDFYDNENKASLDRIDSSLGYVEGNVQWVHKIVNFMKQSLSCEELLRWCKLIIERNK